MKFLPEFALCWGGASITPTANDAAIPLQEEEQTRRRNSGEVTIPSAMPSGRGRRVVKSRNGANWKPALRVISEERSMSDIVIEGNGGRKERVPPSPSSCAKYAAKVKAKSIVRSKLSPRYGDDYRYVINHIELLSLSVFKKCGIYKLNFSGLCLFFRRKSTGPMAVPAFAPTTFLF